MGRPDVSAGSRLDDVKASVSRMLPLMGYSVESSGSLDGGFMFIALRQEPLGGVRTLVYVSSGRSLSQKRIKRVLESAVGLKASKVVLVSKPGLSMAASAFAARHCVEVLDGGKLEGMLLKHGIAPSAGEKIFEFAFELGITLSEARVYFERRRGRRFLGFGVDEKVIEVSGRYAPVGSFLVSRNEEVKTGLLKTPKAVSKSNVFYVNLNTSNLYYAKSGMGTPGLCSSDVLRRLAPLPVNSLLMLAEVLKTGEMSIQELNQRYGLFYEENMGCFRVLVEEGLISPTPGGEGVMPNLTVPAFDSPKYDLRKSTSVVKSVSSAFQVDELKYGLKDVARLLELFYAGNGEVREVVYLPYYACVYADDRGMRRFDILLAPKYAT